MVRFVVSLEAVEKWRKVRFDLKMVKQHMFKPLLGVAMSNWCTQLWRETHFEVKMLKVPYVRATSGRSTAPHHTTP